jgi:hypothetical protein
VKYHTEPQKKNGEFSIVDAKSCGLLYCFAHRAKQRSSGGSAAAVVMTSPLCDCPHTLALNTTSKKINGGAHEKTTSNSRDESVQAWPAQVGLFDDVSDGQSVASGPHATLAAALRIVAAIPL